MPSARTIAMRNSEAAQLIMQGQYNVAHVLLEEGLRGLDDCEPVREGESRACLIELQTVALQRRPVNRDAAFLSFDKVFLIMTPSSPSRLDQENAPISNCEFEVMSSVLWYNIGIVAMLSTAITPEMVPARSAFERALEHLCGVDYWSSHSAILFRLAAINNAAYSTFLSFIENENHLDEIEAMDRLDQLNYTLGSNIDRGWTMRSLYFCIIFTIIATELSTQLFRLSNRNSTHVSITQP